MSGVRKELATLLNQRLPASVSDVQGLRTDMKNTMDEMKGRQQELMSEMQAIRAALDRTPQQEIRDAIALQASMKSVVDELKSIQELVRDIQQGSLDMRVELKAEGDRVTGALADFDARFFAEINYVHRRLEEFKELNGKIDQTYGDLRNLMMMMMIPCQQNLQCTLDDVQWHSREQYNRSLGLSDASRRQRTHRQHMQPLSPFRRQLR